MPPKRRDNELLRMPAPLPVSNIEEFEHYGVVVEKSGEDNETSKKNKVMYLFSPTVRKHCGKLVCSNDWVDYNLGDWMIFTQQKNEAYFGSKHCDDVWKTRIHPYDVTIVQVYVEFFLIPSCISHRKCFNLSEPLTKMWSPQLGGCYVDNKSKNMYQLQQGVVYRGWLQYSVNPVNFDEYDVDPEGWPYEPIVYWHLVHCLPHAHDRSKPSFAIEVVGDEEIYMKYRATLINYAEQATEFERNKRITDRAPMNVFEKSQNNRPKMIEFKPQVQHAKTTSANVTKFDLSSPNNSRDDNPIVFTANTFRLVGMNLGPSPLKPAQSPNSCFREFRTQTPANNQSQDMKQDAPWKTPVNFNSFTPTTKREPKPRKSGFSSILQSPTECSKPWGF